MVKKILIFILPTVLFFGCSMDPTNVSPTNQYATKNYPTSIDGLNSVLSPAYSELRDDHLYGYLYLSITMGNLTHAYNSMYNGDNAWNALANMNVSPNNSYIEGAWSQLYKGVKNCNVALNAADFYMKNYAKPGDKKKVDYIRGQTHFLRGFYYFLLESLFGEQWIPNPSPSDTLGVPIFTGLPKSLAASQKSRSSIKAVWALVESDLQKAASLLKGKKWTGNNIGRVTEWAAKALLGKAYVFTENWPKAETVLKDVIKHSGKSLMTYDKYKASFVGDHDEFNQESLFEINIDQDSKGEYGIYGNVPNATALNGLKGPPWALTVGGSAPSAPLGYGNEIFHDRNVVRFGFNLGYFHLVPNPNFDPNEKTSYKNHPRRMDPVYKRKAIQARTNNTVDPRLFVNALEPRVDSVKLDGIHWYPVAKPAGFFGQVKNYAWSMRKYSPIYDSMSDVGHADASNIYILRLADVYLLYAETEIHQGKNATALEYINKVHRRAYGYPVNSPSPVDYANLTSKTPADIANDPVLGHNPLYYERWAELFHEGWWWFAVCRWHLGESEAKFYGTAYNLSQPIQWDDKTYAWPIPLQEINSNPKLGFDQQNPGY